jgi:transcriptional regulator with XRE-family HTH domain
LLTGGQIRAARALLRLTTKEVSEMSGLGIQTIHRFEQEDGVPPSRSQTLIDLKRAFEEAGVEFTGSPDHKPGVQLK